MSAISHDQSVVLDRDLDQEKGSARPALAFGARSVVGRPARRTAGLARAAMSGTPLTREASAQPVSTRGVRRSASLAAAGRRIRSGMRSDLTLTVMALPQLINTELLV
jgi:hypothetical protein